MEHHGDGWAPRSGRRHAGSFVAVVAGAASVLVALSSCSTGHPATKYGGLPSWLPKSTLPVHRIVQASSSQPKLAVEGDTVSVALTSGRVMATVVGPEVPTTGRYPVPATTPCMFTMTLTQATGAIRIDPADFTILDQQGGIHHPNLSIDGAVAPSTVLPGQAVTLQIDEVLPTGNGQLRWAPGGAGPIVSWDFAVEID